MSGVDIGLRIEKFEASSIESYRRGIGLYDKTATMLGNSLFTDFMLENGLQKSGFYKNETKDIICISFNRQVRTYKEEVEFWAGKIYEKIGKKRVDGKLTDECIKKEIEALSKEDREEVARWEKRIDEAEKNKLSFPGSKDDNGRKAEDLRKAFYANGVDIEYFLTKTKKQKIHYLSLFRTPGKAKQGDVYFIREELFHTAMDFLRMGIKFPDENIPVVQISAYASLIASTIDKGIGENGKIKIDPRNILIIHDLSSLYRTNVISIEQKVDQYVDEKEACVAKKIDDYAIETKLFDGQSLIDESIFPKEADGFVTLREHFFKTAAFNTDIQKFFRDYCEKNNHDYESWTVEDMFGIKHAVKDIKLITTDDSCKWLKFKEYGVDYDYWCKKVEENSCLFGIVKTGHPSKFGSMNFNGKEMSVQQMSYQMCNSLEMESDFIESISNCSKNYVEKLNNDKDFFLKYLDNNKTMTNDYEVLSAICKKNPSFYNSHYFKERQYNIVEQQKNRIRDGKLLQFGDNLTIVANPYSMLLASVGEIPHNDKKIIDPEYIDEVFNFVIPNGEQAIHCYSEKFEPGEFIAEFRSPFNSRSNLGVLYNISHDYMRKYFNFGQQVIAVNLVNSCFAERNNGSDEDGDQIFCCNQEKIVECAKKYYLEYRTVINNLPQKNKTYNNTPEDYAEADNAIAASGSVTGKATNLAQLCLSYTYNIEDESTKTVLEDYLFILSIISQCAIDNAKKPYDVDLASVVEGIRNKVKESFEGHPEFWTSVIKKSKRLSEKQKSEMIKNLKKHIEQMPSEKRLECPMNYIKDIKFNRKVRVIGEDDSSFFQKLPQTEKVDRRHTEKIEEFIKKYSIVLYDYNTRKGQNREDDYAAIETLFDELREDIKKISIPKEFDWIISHLIDKALLITPAVRNNQRGMKYSGNGSRKNTLDKNRPLVLKTLYDIKPKVVLECFSKNISGE